MTTFRLRALKTDKKNATWGADCRDRLPELYYYLRRREAGEDLGGRAADIQDTFDASGCPGERKFLAGVAAQYESEVVYHSLHRARGEGRNLHRHDSAPCGTTPTVQAVLRDVIPPGDHRMAALNSAVCPADRSFYVPRRQGRNPTAGLLPDQRRNMASSSGP